VPVGAVFLSVHQAPTIRARHAGNVLSHSTNPACQSQARDVGGGNNAVQPCSACLRAMPHTVNHNKNVHPIQQPKTLPPPPFKGRGGRDSQAGRVVALCLSGAGPTHRLPRRWEDDRPTNERNSVPETAPPPMQRQKKCARHLLLPVHNEGLPETACRRSSCRLATRGASRQQAQRMQGSKVNA